MTAHHVPVHIIRPAVALSALRRLEPPAVRPSVSSGSPDRGGEGTPWHPARRMTEGLRVRGAVAWRGPTRRPPPPSSPDRCRVVGARGARRSDHRSPDDDRTVDVCTTRLLYDAVSALLDGSASELDGRCRPAHRHRPCWVARPAWCLPPGSTARASDDSARRIAVPPARVD